MKQVKIGLIGANWMGSYHSIGMSKVYSDNSFLTIAATIFPIPMDSDFIPSDISFLAYFIINLYYKLIV